MIVTNCFVFLHLHKSGGTFVNNVISRFFPEAKMIGYHLPGHFLPDCYRDLPVFGFVRDPLSYYVSWYAFQSKMKHPNAIFRVVSKNRSLSFNETISNLIRIGDDENLFRAVLDVLPEEFPNRGINLTKACVERLRGSGLGFYGFMYDRMYGGVENIDIRKMERLRIDLPKLLEAYCGDLNGEVLDFIKSSEKLNTSQHGSPLKYYNASLIKKIKHRDSVIYDAHAY